MKRPFVLVIFVAVLGVAVYAMNVWMNKDRYQLQKANFMGVGEFLYRIDTRTGRTWILKTPNGEWETIWVKEK